MVSRATGWDVSLAVSRCGTMEIQNRRRFPASRMAQLYGGARVYRYAHIYFVLDSVRKLSEPVSRATFGPQTSAGELFSALCLDLSLPKVSNCFRGKSRGTQKYIIAGRDWCANTARPLGTKLHRHKTAEGNYREQSIGNWAHNQAII